MLLVITVLAAYLDYKEFQKENFSGHKWRLFWLAPGAYILNSLQDVFEFLDLPIAILGLLGVVYFAAFLAFPKILKNFFPNNFDK